MAAPLDPRRAGIVTGSNVAAICGENPWSSRRAVLYKMSLRLPSIDTPDTLRGKQNEEKAFRAFCEKEGAECVEYPGRFRTHPVYEWLGGTIDGLARMPDGRVVLVEIKVPRRIHSDGLPLQYVGQVQTYLHVWADTVDRCAFVQMRVAGPRTPEQLDVQWVDRDDRYLALRLPHLLAFWRELMLWSAFTERVVTVIQRAWRSYRARRAASLAAKSCMVGRLRCARIVGKLAGFCRVRELAPAEPPAAAQQAFAVVDDGTRPEPAWKRRRTGTMERGVIYLVCE